MRLSGKSVIITGAASGIGRAAALRMAKEGAGVLALDVSDGGLKETKALGLEQSLKIETGVCNVTDENDAMRTVNRALTLWGGIDVLVNIAGIQITKSVADTTLDDFNSMMAVNMGGAFLFTRAVLPHMERAGKGAIVNLASELAFVGYPDLAGYTATKGAMVAFTRSVALEAIKFGVRVNCVCPGATDTPIFWEGVTDPAIRARMMEQVKKEKPCGRLITTDEVASGIVFMASDEASAVVGTCLVMDGGFTAM
jgi:NAD(P)-dependent dehydrogenase (short-subunit alcohol dehydrogenase family)